MSKDPTKPNPIPTPLHRVSVYSLGEQDICYDTNGRFVWWEDVADIIVEISGLIARIEMAHELHAVFTIKNSREFAQVKHLLSQVFKEKDKK
jgi:hypothetical protein